MGLRFNKSHACALSAFALIAIVGCNKGGGSETVATIDNVPISRADYDDYLMRKTTVSVMTANGQQEAQVAGQLGVQALKDLVVRKITFTLAKQMNVAPTSDDIDKEIEFQRQLHPNFLQQATAANIPLAFIKKDFEYELASRNIITKGITITPADVDAYIKTHPQESRIPPTVQALFVVVKSKKDEADVDRELASGADFQQVAMRYTIAPKSQGVKFPVNNLDSLPPTYKKPLEDTTEGKTTPWISANQAASQYLKLYVQAKTAPGTKNIGDAEREVIRRALAEQKGNLAADLKTRLLAGLKKAKIEVQLDALKNGWQQIETALNSQATPTTPTTGAGK